MPVDWWGTDDGTPLDDDQKEGLLPAWIATRADVNQAELANILSAQNRWRRRRLTVTRLLDDLVIRQLHRDMFRQVWRWAGQYRATERNIGVAPAQVSLCVRNLVDDAQYWLSSIDDDAFDQQACRVHHQLVWIHPFANGNGRLAREMVDLLLRAAGRPPFTWGRTSLVDPGTTRTAYIEALRSADRGDLEPLVSFVLT